MDSFYVALTLRIKQTDDIIEKCKKQLALIPTGKLRIDARQSGKPQFYVTNKDACETYLAAADCELASKLAQRSYCERVLREALHERKQLERLLNGYKENGIAKIWSGMHPKRRELVIPFEITDDEYAEQWQNEPYEGKKLDEGERSFLTERGEHVRSKSEKIIADMLSLRDVPYHYEQPLKLVGWGIVYPDFRILNRRTREEFILEHFGMMDNPEYVKNYVRKIKMYEHNGIFVGSNLLCTYETAAEPLEPEMVDALIRRFLL